MHTPIPIKLPVFNQQPNIIHIGFGYITNAYLINGQKSHYRVLI